MRRVGNVISPRVIRSDDLLTPDGHVGVAEWRTAGAQYAAICACTARASFCHDERLVDVKQVVATHACMLRHSIGIIYGSCVLADDQGGPYADNGRGQRHRAPACRPQSQSIGQGDVTAYGPYVLT
jgi:hypothetical protein